MTDFENIDELVGGEGTTKKSGRKCGACGDYGHNKRTCPTLQTQSDVPTAEDLPPAPPTSEDEGEHAMTEAEGGSMLTDVQSPEAPDDFIPPAESNDELVNLIGSEATSLLETLGLRDKVKISDVETGDISLYDGRNGEPVKIEFENGDVTRVSEVVLGSTFGPVGSDMQPFSPDDMGAALMRVLRPLKEAQRQKDNRGQMVDALRKVSKHMDSLSRVFGFDEMEQLEAFFAAWLMKDSTCRLTGIPGTGKTTVIEAAATLLANSYGFSTRPRYLIDRESHRRYKSGDVARPITFPNGQAYNVNYGDVAFESVRRLWEEWRFNEWDVGSEYSGAYTYDFRFLQTAKKIRGMQPETFSDLLYAEPTIEMKDGKIVSVKIQSQIITEDQIREICGGTIPASLKKSEKGFSYLGEILRTDAGANDGHGFREFLLDHFYDARLDTKMGLDLIAKEMLMETGIAKIDYDKRAEEILYGIEIRQITETDSNSGNTVSSYQFDPTPRPIVTQPVKFFNEANRSGSGVEDAILGLIAEKTVEYRGRTFKSPSFVAWMDTNPHQKGNDLAFVDRIDMELYFGTLNLGSRFSALSERYGSEARGSVPQLQLINGIRKQKGSIEHIRPMRFADLSNVWGLINSIPFTASGLSDSEGGALLDISLLSVLFTQRFMTQGRNVKVFGSEHQYSYDKDVYASPLVDISTTTNLQYTKQHPEDLEKFGKAISGSGAKQAPVLIKRMLGFRFTNSLIKMTRALAFLRGKDYVTRQEVIDALPYCVGHRLGPAREGEDPKGRDIGIDRDEMVLTNEQQFIKELIVHGYLLRDTVGLMGSADINQSMFNLWDGFLKDCRNRISSTDESWRYEKDTLLPLKKEVRDGGKITPVHWGIGTMVVDNKRNTKEYQDRYKHLLERITRPEATTADYGTIPSEEMARQISADKSMSQFLEVRGAICREPMLFSDDRGRLLSLIDSKINAIGGGTFDPMNRLVDSSKMAVSGQADFNNFMSDLGLNTEAFPFRHYNDGMGAWGYLITENNNAQVSSARLGSGDLTQINGIQYEASQELSITGMFNVVSASGSSTNDAFFGGMDELRSFVKPYVSNGVAWGNSPASKRAETFENVEIENWFKMAKDSITSVARKNGKSLNSWLDLNDKGMGIMGCFPLKHVGTPYSMKDMKGDDRIRLWLRLRMVEGDNKDEGQTITFLLTAGITSAMMKDGEFKPVDKESVKIKHYVGGGDWEDSGNLTREDYRFYAQGINNAFHQ